MYIPPLNIFHLLYPCDVLALLSFFLLHTPQTNSSLAYSEIPITHRINPKLLNMILEPPPPPLRFGLGSLFATLPCGSIVLLSTIEDFVLNSPWIFIHTSSNFTVALWFVYNHIMWISVAQFTPGKCFDND